MLLGEVVQLLNINFLFCPLKFYVFEIYFDASRVVIVKWPKILNFEIEFVSLTFNSRCSCNGIFSNIPGSNV